VKLIVVLDDGTDRNKLVEILDQLAAHYPYVRSATLAADEEAEAP
jgi:translation elongation factor EF-G